MKKSGISLKQEFIVNACFRMDESQRMIEKCLALLPEEDIWRRPNTESNSIGNLLLHLEGNIAQYAVSSLSGTPDRRDRDSEFESTSGQGKDFLMERLKSTLARAKDNIFQVTDEELLRIREVQGFKLSGLGIVLHVVEHLSYHTGQIAFWTKIVTGQPLGFYDGVDLNIKNK